MKTKDQILTLEAENAIMRNAIELEIKLGEKQVELLKERAVDNSQRKMGSAIWRMVGRLQGTLDSI